MLATAPFSGQRISEYLLDGLLGAGAFGQVWRARHHVWNDQCVAIKIPLEPCYIRNLQAEGAAIHGLVHPNIVRALGFDPYADPPYLAMEYVPGKSLRPLIEARCLSPLAAISILRQILLGLAHAHGAGVVHRDIKPENVLVHELAEVEGFDSPGRVKITDFGLGKAANIAGQQSIVLSMSVTGDAARQFAGTVDYMSPEQRAGDAVDGRCDLYACGVVLFELLTGQRPVGGELPSELNPDCPAWLDTLFRKSCARLEKRFASAEEFIDALNRETSKSNAPAAPDTRQGARAMSPFFGSRVELRCVAIKPGQFVMGSPPGEPGQNPDERQHTVSITRAFNLSAFAITRRQFEFFVQQTSYVTEAERDGFAHRWDGAAWVQRTGANWREASFEQNDDHPVVNVSWNDAIAFARWLTERTGLLHRLPTEAEWEYACRAGTQSRWFWGDDPDLGAGYANAADQSSKPRFPGWLAFNWSDGYIYTAPVGSFKPNPWGLYDMIGNVWEWCQDFYGSYPRGEVADPFGPPHAAFRILRGASWDGDPSACRSAHRYKLPPHFRSDLVGLRIAREG